MLASLKCFEANLKSYKYSEVQLHLQTSDKRTTNRDFHIVTYPRDASKNCTRSLFCRNSTLETALQMWSRNHVPAISALNIMHAVFCVLCVRLQKLELPPLDERDVISIKELRNLQPGFVCSACKAIECMLLCTICMYIWRRVRCFCFLLVPGKTKLHIEPAKSFKSLCATAAAALWLACNCVLSEQAMCVRGIPTYAPHTHLNKTGGDSKLTRGDTRAL
jgi:hypothetical protein